MPSLDFIHRFLLENFENVHVRGNQFIARCSLCGDSLKSKRKRRFGLKYDNKSSVYHCYNCGSSGSFYQLYAIIKNIDVNDAYRECEPSISENFSKIHEKFLFKEKHKSEVSAPIHTFNDVTSDCLTEYNYEPGTLNESYVSVLKQFRKDRCMPSKIPLFFAYKGRYQGRIVIPVYNANGDIIYFQARSTTDHIIPKYLNPIFPKETIIPNFDFFDTTKPVIVVEGILDMYSINGRNTTCCLGKELNDEFIGKVRTKCRDIIIALDNDIEGKKATKKIIHQSMYGRELKYFIMPYKNIKDLNELSVLYRQQNINMYEFILDNSHGYIKLKSEDL